MLLKHGNYKTVGGMMLQILPKIDSVNGNVNDMIKINIYE